MPFVQTVRNVFHLATVFPLNDKTLKPELKIILLAVPVQGTSMSQVLLVFLLTVIPSVSQLRNC